MNIVCPVEQVWISHFLSALAIIKIKCLIFFWITFGASFCKGLIGSLKTFYPTIVQLKNYLGQSFKLTAYSSVFVVESDFSTAEMAWQIYVERENCVLSVIC